MCAECFLETGLRSEDVEEVTELSKKVGTTRTVVKCGVGGDQVGD